MSIDPAKYQTRMQRFHEQCRDTGLRITPQRLEVYGALARSAAHPSAEAIHRQVRRRLPTITLDTVYRTLDTLEQMGVVERVSVVGTRARFEANMDPHHHFVCRHCGLIVDLYCDRLDALALDEALPAGYQVDSTQLQVRGTCQRCGNGKRDN